MRILSDGRVRFSAWTIPGFSELDFTAIHGDRYSPARYSVSVNWRGTIVLNVFIRRRRVESACFAYHLTPDVLRSAVAVLRDAGGGLERWIVPGLEYTQADLFGSKTDPKWSLLQVIPEVLESVANLPMAEPWRRRRRELQRVWAEHLREHPEDLAQVPAPWLLPTSRKIGSASRGKRRSS